MSDPRAEAFSAFIAWSPRATPCEARVSVSPLRSLLAAVVVCLALTCAAFVVPAGAGAFAHGFSFSRLALYCHLA